MTLNNCKLCGKLIGETPSGYCEACRSIAPEYSNLHKVKDYLYDNPNSKIQVVSRETGVSIAEICKFIESGAIIEVEGYSMVSNRRCSCGTPLKGTEKLCADCRRENEQAMARIKKNLSHTVAEKTAETTPASHKGGFFTQSKGGRF